MISTAQPMPPQAEKPETAKEATPFFTLLDLAYVLYLGPVRLAARMLPPRVFLALCQSMIQLAEGTWRGARDRVARNMRVTFPGAPDDQIRDWASTAVGGFFNRAAQDLVTRRLIAGDHLGRVTLTGLEHLDVARAEGRGVVIFSAHFLATRLARCVLQARGMPILSTRQKTPPRRRVSGWGRRVLQPSYGRLLHQLVQDEVFVEEAGSTLRILRRLREGGIVSAFLDGNVSRQRSTQPLFGVPMAFGVGILEVVRLTRAPLVPVVSFGDWRHLTIEFSAPLDLADAPDRPSFVAANMPRVATAIEDQIRRHPDQWEYWMLGWPGRWDLDAFNPS